MTRIAGASVLLLLGATACGVGDDSSKDPMSGSDGDPVNMIVCTAALKVTGSFAPGTPGRPIDPDTNMPIAGCWPVGTWTFSASIDQNACATPPVLAASYSFRVDRMDPDGTGYVESYAVLSTPAGMQMHIGVSSTAQGCEGNLELGSSDGLQYWNLKPLEANDSTIIGQGDYMLYSKDSWPWK